MPLSMTGFGAAEQSDDGATIRVEMRSVNHRHLDARFRPHTGVPALESALLSRLRKRLSRGHVDIRVTAEAHGERASIAVDLERASAYWQATERIRAHLGAGDSVTIADVAGHSGVIETAPAHELLEQHESLAVAAFDAALTALLISRAAEGERLTSDLRQRIATLQSLRAAIAKLAGGQLQERRDKLHQKLTTALAAIGATVDTGRLEQELVHIADRSDITEELVRLCSHLETFAACLDDDRPVGQKLGFLSQELLREINTAGSKAHDVAITEHVVAAKVELEKVREQVLNLE